jgi:hypothetical protein
VKVTARKITLKGPANIIVRHPKHLDANGAQVPQGTMRTLFSAELRDVTEIFITSFGEMSDTLLTENEGVPLGDEVEGDK